MKFTFLKIFLFCCLLFALKVFYTEISNKGYNEGVSCALSKIQTCENLEKVVKLKKEESFLKIGKDSFSPNIVVEIKKDSFFSKIYQGVETLFYVFCYCFGFFALLFP